MSLYNPEIRRATCKNSGLPRMMTDPLFYAVAVPAVISLGLSKGGSPASARSPRLWLRFICLHWRQRRCCFQS